MKRFRNGDSNAILRQFVLQNLNVNLLAVLVGIVGGFGAVIFRWFIYWVNDLFFFQRMSVHFITPMEHRLGLWVILLPAIGGLLVGLITHFFAPETKGHGVPEVMEAVATKGGRIRPRVVLAKVLASGICLGSGGSAGREGPIVQIGSAAGSSLGQLLKLRSSETRVLLGCGAAAGIAATFNAPLAGVIFAIELILLELKTSSFVPLVIATTFATIVSRVFLGAQPMINVPPYQFRSPYELVLYLVLGVVAGLVGILETKTLYKIEDFFDRLRMHPLFKPALGGLILGAIGLYLPHVFGIGYGTMSSIVNQHLGKEGLDLLGFLLLLGVAKIIALSVTLGSGGSGGVFAPSLFIGAAVGGAFGVAVNLLFPSMTAPYPAYALVGMAAVFSAASRATLTSIIMLFEMTRDYNIILPLMFACVVADIVAWLVSKNTIYTEKLIRRGLHVHQDLEANILHSRHIADVMSQVVETVRKDLPIRAVWERIVETGHQGFPVIDDEDRLIGVVTGREVMRAIREGNEALAAADLVQRGPVTAYPDETLDVAWDRMGSEGVGRLPVMSRQDPNRLIGILTRGDLIRFRKTLK